MRQVDFLIQQRVKSLLIENVYQDFASNQTPGEAWPESDKTKWHGPAAKLEKFLQDARASKFNVGMVQSGLAKYPIYVLNWKTETYWFYHNNEVYSLGGARYGRHLGYDVTTVNGQEQLNLYKLPDQRGEKTYIGNYTIQGSELIWTPKKETTAEEDKEAQLISNIHMALDIAGFIPVIGDAVDLVHAVWYFYEGKIIDGILSSLAVVPVVGSFIAASGKAIYKTLGKLAGKADDMGDVLKAIITKMNPTAAEMKQIHDGLGVVYDKFGKNSSTLASIVGQKTVDDILSALKKARKEVDGKAIDQLQSISKQQATLGKGLDVVDDASTISQKAFSSTGILGKGIINKQVRKLSSLTYEASAKETSNLLVKLINGLPAGRKVTSGIGSLFKLGVKPKNAQALVDAMARGFVKRVKRDPDKLAALIQTSKKLPLQTLDPLKKGMGDIISNLQSTLDVDSIRRFSKRLEVRDAQGVITKFPINKMSDGEILNILTTGAVKIKPKNIENLDPAALRSLMGKLDPKQMDSLGDSIAKHAIDNDNPFWNSMLSDPQSKLKTWLWPGDVKGVKDMLVANLQDVRKWADIVYNEMSAAVGDTVVAEKFPSLVPDEPQRESFIYPAVKSKIKQIAPGTYAGVKKVIGKQGIISKAGPGGLPDESMAEYDPTKSV